MDTEYLKGAVGEALVAGLKAIALEQPKNSVEYLGTYLTQYADMIEAQEAYEKKASTTLASLEAAVEKAATDAAAEQAIQDEKVLAVKISEDSQIESILSDPSPESIMAKGIQLISSATGASGIYIGKVKDNNEEGAPPAMTYISASSNSQFMIGKTLQGPSAEADPEEVPPSVTFSVFNQLPEEPLPEDAPEDMPPPEPKFPEYLHIEDVLSTPGVKFFGVPKLGAYLAVPVKYTSGLHDLGIGAPVEVPTPIEGEEGEATTTPPESSWYSKVEKEIKLIIGLDTMGQARKFTAGEIAKATRFAGIIGEALNKAEAVLYEEEIKRVEALREIEFAALASVPGPLKDAVTASVEGNAGIEDEGEKALADKTSTFTIFSEAVKVNASGIDSLATCLIKPAGAGLFNVLQATIVLLGSSIMDVETWDDVRNKLTSSPSSLISSFNPTTIDALPPRSVLDMVKSLVESISPDEVETVSLWSWILVKWVNASIDLLESLHDKKEAEAAASEE